MKITLIGHITKDVFHLPVHGSDGNAEQREQWGGIVYSLLTLANLISKEDTLLPVFGVSETAYEQLLARLQPYSNIQTKGIFPMKGEINRVHYFTKASGTEIECSKNIAPPIPFAKIKPFLDTDGALINMISGSDITLETLDYIRMHIRNNGTPVHFDFHSLTLGVDDKQARFPRPLTDWRRWCFMTNSIQMNEHEAAMLTAERFDEPTLINHLMPLMVNALVVTRGSNGATLIQRDHKKLFRHDIAETAQQPAIDTTGCGDVFGAAFFYQYLATHDFLQAATFANRVAAIKSTFIGVDGLDSLQQQLTAKVASEQQ